ncbi:hypothetical protein [Pseudomonas sp. NPDC089569]|uniref:hypothetical protein n=1 Tax=Pseudomonas sp. NPDC089569 TaxID=3390722 RepID=UPI003D005368
MPTCNLVALSSGVTVPVFTYNSVMRGDGFFISFNDHDTAPSLYGDVTTALVFGQMQAFYILNGDHRAAYAGLLNDGFDACLAYFKANIDSINKRSQRP